MKQTKLLRLTLLLITLLWGAGSVWADEVTLAQWYPTSSVLYTAGTGDKSNYYTASKATYTTIQKNFSDGQPYFYPTACNVGSTTDYTLSFWSSGSGKQWAIRNYNNSAFAFYTQPVQITDYLDGTQHDNYMEVNFPATGYKNLKLSFQISGNNGYTVPLIVVVSTDGGTTWQYGGNDYSSGSSWSNFNKSDVSLAVTNCANVKVRILQGYNSGATSDWYQKEISITGEAIGSGESVYTLTVTKPDNGLIQISPVGGSFAESEATSITATAIPDANYAFTKWSDNATDNPYTFSLTSDKALSATFASATYYTLTTGTNLPWAGKITCSPSADSYVDGTVVTLTAAASEGFTFTGWSTGENTVSINVTMDDNKTVTANYDKTSPTVGTENATLVSWIFNGQYDAVAGDGNEMIYTPTGGSYSTISYNYSAQTPVIRPDYYFFGNASDYKMTGKCDTKWMLGQFYSGSDHYVFYLGSSKSMANVTDYTNPSTYQNYFEASFPTTFTGLYYDNIKITFTPSANNENSGMEYGVVYSIDNGTTWTQIATVNAASHWNGFDQKEVNLPADAANKSKVIVRIIRKEAGDANSEDNKLDEFTVTGTVKSLSVTMNEDADYTPAALDNANVTLTRTINADNWSTICLPFDMTAEQVTTTFGEGTKLAGISGYAENTLNTVEQTTITANEPCFIRVANNFSSATIDGVTIKEGTPEKEIDGSFKLVGTYSSGTIADGDYFLSNNNLYQSTGKSKIKPFRAYFTGVPTEAQARIAFFSDGEITFINDVPKTGNEIPANPVYYNLNGQRVISPSKGLYIVNGKKVVID